MFSQYYFLHAIIRIKTAHRQKIVVPNMMIIASSIEQMKRNVYARRVLLVIIVRKKHQEIYGSLVGFLMKKWKASLRLMVLSNLYLAF